MFLRCFLGLFCLFSAFIRAEPLTITVVGTGLTGLWTAYNLSKDLEEAELGEGTVIHLVGAWDFLEAQEKAEGEEVAIFSHEASGFGPIGIQPHSGLLWNTDSEVVSLVKNGIGKPAASFYTDSNLEEAGREFLELYVGWHGRHSDKTNDPASSYNRQKALIDINRYARKLWGQFAEEFSFENSPFDLYLEGAWRLYDDHLLFANALNSLKILEEFHYGAEAVDDSEELSKRLPFYKEIILKDQKKGIFFRDDGFLDSNKLRKYLWDYLNDEKLGKPKLVCHFYSPVKELLNDQESGCSGVKLMDDEIIASDFTILCMGLENKKILSLLEINLPLWSIWGAALKGKLIGDDLPPKGGVSFHRERCITGSPDQKTMILAGTSMVVSEGEIPEPSLYQPKLLQNLEVLFPQSVSRGGTKFLLAPRTGIPDDLPVIGLTIQKMDRLIVLNPTSHLGNTQAIALGKLASTHVLQQRGFPRPFPEELHLENYRLERFQNDIDQVRVDHGRGHSLLF